MLMLSEIAQKVLSGPLHRGPMDGATHYGVSGSPGNGPYVEIWLLVEGGLIRQAAFKTPGCPSSTAAAGVLCTLISGRELERAMTLTTQNLLAVLGGLPEGRGHYADMCIEAMNSAEEIRKC